MDFLSRQESQYIESSYAPRAIKVFRNGDSSSQADIVLKQGITFEQLKAETLQKLGLRPKGPFRLFTSEGLELYEDYLPLIKDRENLYVSLGEDFDQNTSMAEYEEIELIGRGGFGKVVLAEHRQTYERFAIKYVDAKKYGLASLIDMVFSEAELLKNLKHKNIVEILNFFKLKDLRVAFVMEYLEGGELGHFLEKKGKLTEQEALEIFTQLVDAVHFCHINKIIHRDLKLENILFESKYSNVIKVVDFGIAGLYSGYKFDVSDAGSLRYMAPEILTGENKAANPAMDIWSMGCILFALLHGRPPFTGHTSKEIVEMIVKCEYKFDNDVKNRVSPMCLDLINKMLHRDYTTRVTTYDIKEHPWLNNGQGWVDNTEKKEVKEDGKDNERPKDRKLSNLINDVVVKKKVTSVLKSVGKEKLSNSFNFKDKVNTSEVRTLNRLVVPGQNTLNRAISREAGKKVEDKFQPKKEIRSSFRDIRTKETEGKKDDSLLKKGLIKSFGVS